MQRVVRCDGILPVNMIDPSRIELITPDDLAPLRAYVDQHRSATTPFDLVIESWMPRSDQAFVLDRIAAFAAVGATWRVGNAWATSATFETPGTVDQMRERIHQGPPRTGEGFAIAATRNLSCSSNNQPWINI